jgi:acyl-CoA thioester hydrolase
VTTSPLRVLHQAVVSEEEIDPLGHMNVRFYLEKAFAATGELAARLGLDPQSCREHDARLELRESYTRHYREQLVGARLEVRGGVLSVGAEGLRLYHELLNPERDERAATFVHALALRRGGSDEDLPLPEIAVKRAADATVAWPEHGRPRTIDLERTPPTIPLALARERGLAMREPRVVHPDECDAEGRFVASRYLDLVWNGEPTESRTAGVPLFELADGRRFGWATMESRGVLYDLPRAGTRIQSFGAEVALAEKTSYRHHWVFDHETGRLLCTSSIVNLAFDIGARRATPIPPEVRSEVEARYHPDLR